MLLPMAIDFSARANSLAFALPGGNTVMHAAALACVVVLRLSRKY